MTRESKNASLSLSSCLRVHGGGFCTICFGLLGSRLGDRMGWFGRLTAVELRRELLRLEETERAGWLIAAREESCGRPLLLAMDAACG